MEGVRFIGGPLNRGFTVYTVCIFLTDVICCLHLEIRNKCYIFKSSLIYTEF